MPRRFIKSYMPDHRRIREQKSLRVLGDRLHHPGLWHLSRRSVAGALALGVFSAFIPLPFQMLLAAALSIWLRVNLPLAIATVWITNPITIPPIFYFTYRVGVWLLNLQPLDLKFELTWSWLSQRLDAIWQPLLLGSLTVGITLGTITYLATSFTWRWYVVSTRRSQRERRIKKINPGVAKPD